MIMTKRNIRPFYFISHYYDSHHPLTGGEKYNFQLVQALQDKGYPLTIYTDDKIPGYVIKRYLLYNFWYLIRFNKFRNGVLLVDSYMHPRLFIFLFFLKIFTKTKIIGTVHHLYWCIQRNRFKRLLDKIVERCFIAQIDYLITPSRFTLASVKQIVSKLPKAKIIYPGLDHCYRGPVSIRRQYREGQTIKIMFVGAIQERKGVIDLVLALSRVTYKDFIMYLVGDQRMRLDYVLKVKNLIKEYELENKIHLCGRISDEDLHHLYLEADIFVLPSYHEGYGIVIAEAMQFGLPIVASNISALPELVHNGVNGFLITAGDVKGIARAIDELAWSPSLRKKFSDKSRALSSHINTWEEVKRQFITIVDEAVLSTIED